MRLFIIVLALVGLTAMTGFTAVGGGDIVFKDDKAGNVLFSHDIHVAVGQKCTDCHDALYTTNAKHKKVAMAQMRQGQSCGVCHDGKKAFSVTGDCKTCHKK